MSGKLIVVSGAQFGSEGKGAVADQLTRPEFAGNNVVAVRVAGPNAGHTVYGVCPTGCVADSEHMSSGAFIGHPWKLRSVPVSAVCNPDADLVIAAGSEIDRSVLLDEVTALDLAGYNVSSRLYIDAQATVLEPKHIDAEVADGIQKRLGSTAKGIGAARADRLWRYATLWGDVTNDADRVNTADFIRTRLSEGATVMIEGTQGYGLGLHAGNYPKCTSSDCRAIDFLAMTGVSPWEPEVEKFEVWLVARVRPIRVAGNSGPLKGETTWADLGLPEERTTVTRKIRRVGEWDGELVRRAVIENGGRPVVRLALTMVDTVFPWLTGYHGTFNGLADDPEDLFDDVKVKELFEYIERVEDEVGAAVHFIGTSPTTGIRR